jgi:cadmium resistance protein CadD (predicted permease)
MRALSHFGDWLLGFGHFRVTAGRMPRGDPRLPGPVEIPPVQWWVTTGGLAVAVFASTNVDDLLILSLLFADPGLAGWQVVAGQFLGIAALTAASILCAALALVIPEAWIGLLGVLPLALGCRNARTALSRTRAREGADSGGVLQFRLQGGQVAGVLAVAGVTIANGGDNLGVYVPLFSSSPTMIVPSIIAFAVMTGLWCLAAHRLVTSPALGGRIRRVGRRLLPIVLIGLGLWILRKSLPLLSSRTGCPADFD